MTSYLVFCIFRNSSLKRKKFLTISVFFLISNDNEILQIRSKNKEMFMVQIRPFRGLRPIPEKISGVASPPYDVLDSEEAREKAKDNPISFLHVNKPEIDLDPSIDIYDPQVYAKGAENLNRLISNKVLVQDEKPNFYIYKLKMGDHEQVGLVVAASVEDYVHNRIKKHEHTRPDKELDRATHIDSLNAQAGPVFLTYRAQEEIDSLIKIGMAKGPTYEFVGDYDVVHTFYVVDDDELIEKIQTSFEKTDALYVADGHHRSAAAVRVRDKRKNENPNHTGEESYNYFLSVVFPDSQMKILDYNRAVADLNGNSTDGFIEKVSKKFDVTPFGTAAYHPEGHHSFGMYLKDQWYILEAKTDAFDVNDPIKRLDVSILQENLLNPILGIENPRTDNRIKFVGGIRGLQELEKLVNGGKFEVAFALYPTSIHQLLDVADANEVMPPKSTWFEPKLRSGVVIHKLD